MSVDLSQVTIWVTKPDRKPAKMLAELGINVLPVEEDEGDVDRYILGKRVAIERRTGGSFLKGVMEKTLFTSAIYLKEHFRVPMLILEGQVNYEYTMFDPQASRGALSSMMVLYGLNVLTTRDLEETVNLIAMIARQEQIGIPDISLIPKRKATDLADMQRRLIEMLPGCGMVMARDLLQHFGSVSRVVNATEAELLGMRGIGAKKAKEMISVLQAEYESVDTERHLEDAIEAEPELLLDQPIVLVSRQHYIYTEDKERHIVDLVFLDDEAEELILVELKRGKLSGEHVAQLRRYLDNAHKSKRLQRFLEKGAGMRGILATVEEGEFKPKDRDISARVVDRKRVIEVLKRLRKQRFESTEKAT